MKRLLGLLILVFVVVAYSYYQPTKNDTVVADTKTPVISPSVTPTVVPSNTPVPDTPTSIPNPTATPTAVPASNPSSQYRDGQFTGDTADAGPYGQVQVQATISGGKLTDVQFLQYPSDRSTSVFINEQAMPMLRSEAIQAQSAQVDIISGASSTSEAFQVTLASALAKAKNS